MHLHQPATAASLAELLDAQVLGPADTPVQGLNEIHVVQPGDLVFVDHPKYYRPCLESVASVVLINQAVDAPPGKALLLSDDPFRDFNRLLAHFAPDTPWFQGFTPQASGEGARWAPDVLFGPGVVLGAGVQIGPGCVIGPNVRIGAHTVLAPRVSLLEGTLVGAHCKLNTGCVLGADAFYYKNRGSHRDRLLSRGQVILEDCVEIGANTTLDRGATGATQVGAHTKIDNLVQVGHDCAIGKHCILAAQVGLAGTVVVEDEVTLWGQVGVATGVRIGQGATVLAKSGVSASLPGGETYWGSPPRPARQVWREMARLRKLLEQAEQ